MDFHAYYSLGLSGALFLCGSNERYAWSTLLLFSLLSIALNAILQETLGDSPNVCFWFALWESLKIVILCRRPTWLGVYQSICLVMAWITHFLLFLDLVEDTNFIYARYESTLYLIAVMQLAPALDDMARKALSSTREILASLRMALSSCPSDHRGMPQACKTEKNS